MRFPVSRALLAALVLFLHSSFLSAEVVDQAYLLGPGDTIKIVVFGEPDLSMEVIVDETGSFEYPFIGAVQVRNRTLTSIERTIDGGLRDGYLVDPNVSVSMLRYRPFYINGEVKKPGGYAYQPGLTVIQAISVAGGYTERASKDRLLIQRDGKSETYRTRHNSLVGPGDIITVEQGLF